MYVLRRKTALTSVIRFTCVAGTEKRIIRKYGPQIVREAAGLSIDNDYVSRFVI